MTDVLVYADTFRSPELRHEVPLSVPDPFLYLERDGVRHVVASSLEAPRLRELGLFEVHPYEAFGRDELRAQGLESHEVELEIAARAVAEVGITAARVPATFPLELADRLRAGGVEVTPDRALFAERRRVKTPAELAGMRRAQRAAEAAMDTCRELLRAGGGDLTVERVKTAMNLVFVEHGCTADEFIVAPGAQGAVGHDMGSGPIRPGVPVIVDIWPRDNETAVFCDMTRTFVTGDVPADVREWHRLCKEALDRTFAEVRAGASGRAIHELACDIFEAAGEPTGRTKEPGTVLADGFFHGLGHGVGLEVHEEPPLGLGEGPAFVAGDVITLEPGLYRQGYGGVRLEDLVLVTEDGAENLTHYPYDLEP
ncbi:MAG TPA: Xaa-Pro peptidase family protein [Gaiellaceae bacterium]|nr:Xaa-Pro peptidase family protein [Gaiellaceae bacterium]